MSTTAKTTGKTSTKPTATPKANAKAAAKTPAKAQTNTAQAKTPPKAGSNSAVPADQLKAYVERMERLNEEAKVIAEDKKEVMAEAKANGFDTGTIKSIIKLRAVPKHEREEKEAMLDLYLHALGMAGEHTEAERKGMDAASAGVKILDNPYTTEDPRFSQWAQGWQTQTTLLATSNPD